MVWGKKQKLSRVPTKMNLAVLCMGGKKRVLGSIIKGGTIGENIKDIPRGEDGSHAVSGS